MVLMKEVGDWRYYAYFGFWSQQTLGSYARSVDLIATSDGHRVAVCCIVSPQPCMALIATQPIGRGTAAAGKWSKRAQKRTACLTCLMLTKAPGTVCSSNTAPLK